LPIVSEQELIKDISEKKFSNVYLLFGNDTYLIEYYSKKLSSLTCTGDPFFNLQKFENGASLQEIYDAVKQYPMMADSKCVVLSDFDYKKAEKSEFDKLCNLIGEVEDGCVLLLVFNSMEFDAKREAKPKKLVSLVEKSGGKVVCLDHRDKYKLSKMLINGAAKRNCELASVEANYLVDTVGEDISLLKNELDKLCAFVQNGKITKETIDNVCIKSVESTVFNYAKFISNGELSKALAALDEMFFMRIEPLVILHTVSSVYIDMYRVLATEKSGISLKDLASDFDYKSKMFLLDKAKLNLKRFDVNKLDKSFECLLNADKTLKSFSCDDRQLLEKLTVKLTMILWGE